MPHQPANSTRNARLTLLIAFLSDLTFILPVWLLFSMNELGLSATLATVLFMTIWMGSGLLEVPTGALADRLGRKRMFLIGVALLSLYPLVYIFELPVFVIFIVSVIAAFGSALRSGTLMPLVHDAYKKDGRPDRDYHNFLSSEKTITFIARAISGVVGGLLYTFEPHAPYAAIFLTYIGMFIAGIFIIDHSTRSTLSNKAHIADTLKAMWQTPLIVTLFVICLTYMVTTESIWTAYQVLFKDDGFNPTLIGTIFSGIAVLSALGAYVTRFIMRRYGVALIETMIGLSAFVTAFMLWLPWEIAHVIAVIPMGFALGIASTPIIATIQKHIKSEFHSTALSVYSLMIFGMYGAASIYAGVLLDLAGIDTTRTIIFVQAGITAVFLICYYIVNIRKDRIISPKDDISVEAADTDSQ